VIVAHRIGQFAGFSGDADLAAELADVRQRIARTIDAIERPQPGDRTDREGHEMVLSSLRARERWFVQALTSGVPPAAPYIPTAAPAPLPNESNPVFTTATSGGGPSAELLAALAAAEAEAARIAAAKKAKVDYTTPLLIGGLGVGLVALLALGRRR
jgi:hypothetical protein